MARPRAGSPRSPVNEAGMESSCTANGRNDSCALAAIDPAHNADNAITLNRRDSRMVRPEQEAGGLATAGSLSCKIDILILEREASDPLPGCRKIRIEHGRCRHADRRLTDAAPWRAA